MPQDPMGIGLIALAILASAFLRGLTGFGFAMAAVPLLALSIDPVQAVTLTVLLQIVIGSSDMPRMAREIDRTEITRMSLGALLGVPMGMAGLLLMSPAAARVAIATVALIGLVLILPRPKRQYHPAAWISGLIGLASGAFSGLAAMPGPPAVAYVMACGMPPLRARATLMALFLVTAILTLPGLIWAGAVTGTALLMTALCWPMLLLGSWAGRQMFLRMGDGQYRAAALATMAIATAISGWRGLSDLL